MMCKEIDPHTNLSDMTTLGMENAFGWAVLFLVLECYQLHSWVLV